MKGAASGVVGDLARARIALDERGQKLGELEERTAAMMASADSFSKHAHEVTENAYKFKKNLGRAVNSTSHSKDTVAAHARACIQYLCTLPNRMEKV